MEKLFAYLVIADSDGVRDVPIGFIDQSAKIIGIKHGAVPSVLPPPRAENMITPQYQPTLHAQQFLPALVLGAFAVAAYQHGGALAVAGFAILTALMLRIGRQSWQLARNRPSVKPGGASSARSAPSPGNGPAPAAGA